MERFAAELKKCQLMLAKDRAKSAQPGDIAFWRYDSYPYILFAKVAEPVASPENERSGYYGYYMEGYGRYIFYPFAALPEALGLPIAEKLTALKAEYESEQNQLKKIYRQKLFAVDIIGALAEKNNGT